MWRLWVSLGAAVWLLTIAASGAINYLAGFELGHTPAEGQVFALLGVAADGWKAIGPIFLFVLWRVGRIVAACLGALVWVACFVFAVSSAMGLAAHNRSMMTGGREATRASYEMTAKELADAEARRGALGASRSTREIEAAIAVVFAKPVQGRGTVGSLSENCSKDNWRTREECASVATMREELARGVEAERLDQRIGELRRDANRLRERGGTFDADPQARLISRVTFGLLGVGDVGLALVLVLVTMVEVISAFAPVVLTEYATAMKTPTDTAVGRGTVYEYMAERVRPAFNGRVAENELLADYRAWCASAGLHAMPEHGFIAAFERICRQDLEGKVRREAGGYVGFVLLRKSAILSTDVAACVGKRRLSRAS